jgi:hypothetical protein
LPQKDLATLVGASREKVNRQLRQWEQQGALVHEHCYVHILKPNSLVTDESQAYPQANGDRHLISASVACRCRGAPGWAALHMPRAGIALQLDGAPQHIKMIVAPLVRQCG